MAVVEMTLSSRHLMMETGVTVILPENRHGLKRKKENKKYPVVYVLHGFTENHSAWIRKSSIEEIVRDLEVIVVMPETNNSFYVDGKSTPQYQKYLTEELPIKIQNFFHASNERKDTFIMGNSMGGYGAFYSAMNRPDLYSAAYSFSGALALPWCKKTNLFMNHEDYFKAFQLVFGNNKEEYLNSKMYLPNLARSLDEHNVEKPRLCAICGTEDMATYQSTRIFVEFVQKETNLQLKYLESPGDHDFNFWNQYIEDAFEFFGIKDQNMQI